MNKTLILLAFLIEGIALGQTNTSPRLHLVVNDTMVVDILSNSTYYVPMPLRSSTNFNPSVSLTDTALAIIADSLHTDGVATIFTVYETDADSAVSLWQVGSGGNRVLWLNSQRVSYDDFSVTYRNSNEHGAIVHSMQYQYPVLDSNYNGRDTLFLGREGNTFGDKNLCAFLYFPGRLDYQYKCKLESALAIRYGAVLHGSYINSHSDTLWNPLADDSLFSVGICGIGRDDSLSLLQPKSAIRNGIMTLEAATMLSNLEHIFLGCDTGSIDLSDDVVFVDTVSYTSIARQWKLRAHTYGHGSIVRLTVGLPLPADAMRLMLTTADGTTAIIAPDTSMAFTVNVEDGQDYYISLLVNLTIIPSNAKGGSNQNFSDEESTVSANIRHSIFSIQLAPNPTLGHYAIHVSQPDDDIINIRVVDANGRVVEQHSTSEPLSQYSHNGHLSADGIYYITVTSNGRQQTIKLIVIH